MSDALPHAGSDPRRESPDLEDRLWDLIGLDLASIGAERDPVFWFGDRHLIEVFADTDLDPWVLSVPGLVLVGSIPEPPAEPARERVGQPTDGVASQIE